MSASNKLKDEILSDEEIVQRRDAALLRALSTPHKRQAEMKVGSKGTGSNPRWEERLDPVEIARIANDLLLSPEAIQIGLRKSQASS
jgi:hypothetical protein